MKARSHIFHVDCFRCVVCARQLVSGDEFALRDDARLLCKADHEAAYVNNNNGQASADDSVIDDVIVSCASNNNNDVDMKTGKEEISDGNTDLYKYSPDAVPPIHAVSYHVATDKPPPPKMATSSGSFLTTIYNQSQLAERKHVARYWSINTAATAVPLSAHPSPFVITAKLATAILGGGGGYSEEVFCRPCTASVICGYIFREYGSSSYM